MTTDGSPGKDALERTLGMRETATIGLGTSVPARARLMSPRGPG